LPPRFFALLKPSRKKAYFALALVLGLVLPEMAYYAGVFDDLPTQLPAADLVLVYSGGEDRLSVVQQLDGEGKSPKILFSGWDYTRARLERVLAWDPARMLVEDRSRTTDQNARFCAPIIRGTGAKKVVLALPWYHLPRALFLTRYYLLDSGITVTPYATTPLPPHWWSRKNYYLELLKFWGSLGRIALSWVGFENPIFHFDSDSRPAS